MGRLILQGVDYTALSMRDWLDVSLAAQIDLPDGMVNRYEVIEDTRKRLARPIYDLLVEAGAVKPRREGWGRSSEAVAGQRAMMAASGGPAPMRPPDAKRPEAWKVREEATDGPEPT